MLAARSPSILIVLPPGLALCGSLLASERRRRGIVAASYFGFPILALATPLAMLAHGAPPLDALATWAVAGLFFVASIATVDIRIRGRAALRLAVAMHGGLIVAAAAASIVARPVGIFVTCAVVATLRLMYVLADVDRFRALALKRVGMIETAVALALVVATAFVTAQ